MTGSTENPDGVGGRTIAVGILPNAGKKLVELGCGNGGGTPGAMNRTTPVGNAEEDPTALELLSFCLFK